MKKSDLSVPSPCSENWDSMSEVHQGRHCSVCQTTVYDFASMTDEEITNFFLNYKGGKLCGRIIEQQPIQHLPRKIARRSFSLRAIFVGLSLMAAFTTTIKAGGIVRPHQLQKVGEMPEVKVQPKPSLIKPYQFKGKITAKKVDLAQAYVEIFVNNQKVASGHTNEKGEFYITGYVQAESTEFYIQVTHEIEVLRTAMYKFTTPTTPIEIDFKDFVVKKSLKPASIDPDRPK